MLAKLPTCKVAVHQLAGWISLIEDCYIHDLGGWANVHEHVEDVLTYFEVPPEWRAIVRVMSQGAHYYSEDTWWAKHVDPSQRKDWMDEYWDQN